MEKTTVFDDSAVPMLSKRTSMSPLYAAVAGTAIPSANGGAATDIGWQYMEANHGSQYRAVAGGPTRDTVKYSLGPDVLLKQDGTLVMPTAPDSSLYWLLYDDFLPVDFSTLGLST